MRALAAFVCCFIFSTVVSLAKDPERSCRIIFPQRPKDAPEEVRLFDGTSSHKVSLPDMNFSEAIRLPGGDLVLRMANVAASNAGDVPQDAPQVKIPSEMTDFYLVVLSDPKNASLHLRMLPLDAGDANLRPGQTLWVNLTAHRIAGDLGEASLEIPPNGNVVGTAPLKSNGYFKAKFRYQPGGSGDFLPVMEKSWWFDAKSRNLGFVFESDIGFPRIFTFRDQRQPANP